MTDRDRLKKLHAKAHSEWLQKEYDHKTDKNISEYAADYLIANGVIVPPCKIGDEIWYVFTPKYPADPDDKGKWFMVKDGVQRIIYGARGLSIETWNVGTISEKEIGKKLFFTRKEAKIALAEKRRQKDVAQDNNRYN